MVPPARYPGPLVAPRQGRGLATGSAQIVTRLVREVFGFEAGVLDARHALPRNTALTAPRPRHSWIR